MTNHGLTLPLTGIAHSTAPSRRPSPTPGKAAHCHICLLELLLSESEKLLSTNFSQKNITLCQNIYRGGSQ